MRRREFLLGAVATAAAGCAVALSEQERLAVDALGRFESVRGRPGVVVAAPHGTADTNTLPTAREIRERTGAGGVFVTGFWDPATRRRINVNRDTEQVIGPHSEVTQQAYSVRAAYVNARYTALVREVSQGPLRWFFEIHANSYPERAGALEVSTLGVSRDEAARFKEGFLATRDRSLPATAPRFGIVAAPLDRTRFDYRAASSISDLSQRGFLIEHPSVLMRDRAWRPRYAEILADVIRSMIA
jgi:hypothetical protein